MYHIVVCGLLSWLSLVTNDFTSHFDTFINSLCIHVFSLFCTSSEEIVYRDYHFKISEKPHLAKCYFFDCHLLRHCQQRRLYFYINSLCVFTNYYYSKSIKYVEIQIRRCLLSNRVNPRKFEKLMGLKIPEMLHRQKLI